MRFDRTIKVNTIMASLIVFSGIFLDQLTKNLADKYLDMRKPVVLIDGFLNLSLVKNTGAAFGIGQQWSHFWRMSIFLGLSCVAIIFITILLYKSLKGSKLLIVSLSMILSGAIGNVYDRIVQKFVIDFVEVYYKTFHWPNFNFADAVICVGVGLFIIQNIVESKGKTKPQNS